MMSLVSELSMNQANALKLQQELKEKEDNLEQAYIRMEKGEPPSEEIDREWLRHVRDEEKHHRDLEFRLMVCQRVPVYVLLFVSCLSSLLTVYCIRKAVGHSLFFFCCW